MSRHRGTAIDLQLFGQQLFDVAVDSGCLGPVVGAVGCGGESAGGQFVVIARVRGVLLLGFGTRGFGVSEEVPGRVAR